MSLHGAGTILGGVAYVQHVTCLRCGGASTSYVDDVGNVLRCNDLDGCTCEDRFVLLGRPPGRATDGDQAVLFPVENERL